MTQDKAMENLRRLTEQLQAHVNECKPHETVASRELLLWFIDAAAKILDKKKPIPLESALGLKRGRGRIKTGQPGRYFQLALTRVGGVQISLMVRDG